MLKPFIIAEAGCNHNGSLNIAKKLIISAKGCGVDAVKFQIFRAKDIIRKGMKKSAHLKNIKEDSVLMMMRNLEFNQKEYSQLKNIACREAIILFASVFDVASLRLANKLGFPIIKIPSGEITNLELLTAASKSGKPIILSTGMSTLAEVERAVGIILNNLKLKSIDKRLISKFPFFKKGLILMHTVSAYPALSGELNLQAINTLKTAFGFPVGYSDHSSGDEACLLAVALGAELIEKHFTLDRDMNGPDHKASIEPGDFKNLIDRIKVANSMLGSGVKMPSRSEKETLLLFRRAIVAKKNIKKGEIIRRGILEIKRPLDGISCEKMNEILGLKARTDIKAVHSLKWKDLF